MSTETETAPADWHPWRAIALVSVLVGVVVLGIHAIAAIANWAREPSVPDECYDDASHERSYVQCDHLDHRIAVEGEYAVCRCTRSDDG